MVGIIEVMVSSPSESVPFIMAPMATCSKAASSAAVRRPTRAAPAACSLAQKL